MSKICCLFCEYRDRQGLLDELCDDYDCADEAYCRLNPPQFNPTVITIEKPKEAREDCMDTDYPSRGFAWAFPVVCDDDWCSHFKMVRSSARPEYTNEGPIGETSSS